MYINPYEKLDGGSWQKTNFHTHAGTGSGTCGRNPIDLVLNLYKELNYDALCISNHDLYSDTSVYDDGKGIYLIQGVEYSQNEHMLSIGVNKSLHDLPHQQAINESLAQGCFTILCHPNWMYKEFWPWKKLDTLTGYVGIEVINMLIYRLNGSGLASDTWDYLLKQGKLVYGFGNDDFHMPFDAGRSFNLIYSFGRGYESIKEAVTSGRFVASTGVYLDYLTLENDIITVKAKFPTDTYVDTFTYRFITENGLVSTAFGRIASYKMQNDNYVRVEVIAENGAMLFTQPIYKAEMFKKP